jgi:tetratricopeptide (TPR) repeat protein
MAQTVQSGYVKTRGRLENGKLIPGSRIDGAAITLMSGHSTVSAADGSFKLTVPDRKFFLKNVQKQGYSLLDPEMLNKSYQCSTNPLVITMENPAVLESDQLTKERKLRRELENRLQKREDEIVAMTVSLEEKNHLLEQVDLDRENNEKIVKGLAKYYATLDYDQLDEFQRQVSALLEQGELEKADSMLRSLGSITDRIAEVRREQEAEAKAAEELARQQQQLEEAQRGTQQKLEAVAADCFNFYHRFLLGHQNDSAAYYLILRANLDTTNVEWQLDAGAFLEEYMADYNQALAYYQRAARQAIATFGEQHPLSATCYSNIGAAYTLQGNHLEALLYLNKSLEIRKVVLEENHPDMATSYNNIGAVYDMQGQYPSAVEYYQKALEIRKASLGENHRDVARSYNSLGKIYGSQAKYSLAMECFQEALRIYAQPDVALVYNDMGSVCFAMKEFDKAIECFQKALKIWSDVYGERHPQVALAYNNIGVLYNKQKDYDKALEYDMKAMNIRKSVYGENHPSVAGSYNNVGSDFLQKKDFATAMEYYQKAVDILIRFYGETHPDLATIYKNMGKACSSQEDHEKAVEYYRKALGIRKAVYGDGHPEVAISYNNLGAEYAAVQNYDSALVNMQHALEIKIAFYGPIHYDVAVDYGNIGYIYYLQGDTKKAVKNLQKAVEIMKEIPGLDASIIQAYENMIEEVKENGKKQKQ